MATNGKMPVNPPRPSFFVIADTSAAPNTAEPVPASRLSMVKYCHDLSGQPTLVISIASTHPRGSPPSCDRENPTVVLRTPTSANVKKARRPLGNTSVSILISDLLKLELSTVSWLGTNPEPVNGAVATLRMEATHATATLYSIIVAHTTTIATVAVIRGPVRTRRVRPQRSEVSLCSKAFDN